MAKRGQSPIAALVFISQRCEQYLVPRLSDKSFRSFCDGLSVANAGSPSVDRMAACSFCRKVPAILATPISKYHCRGSVKHFRRKCGSRIVHFFAVIFEDVLLVAGVNQQSVFVCLPQHPGQRDVRETASRIASAGAGCITRASQKYAGDELPSKTLPRRRRQSARPRTSRVHQKISSTFLSLRPL